jgi:membrane fusion protein, copper/silver efflux system
MNLAPSCRLFLLSLLALPALACPEPPWPDVTPEPAPPAPPARVTATPAASPPAPAAHEIALEPEALAVLRPLFAHNDAIHVALAGDTMSGVDKAATAIAEAALAARPLVKDATLQALLADVETRARHLAHGGDIEAQRLTYGELSKPLVALTAHVPALREGRHVFVCPMAKGYQKWLQAEPSLRNPYFGARMLTCGEESDWAP